MYLVLLLFLHVLLFLDVPWKWNLDFNPVRDSASNQTLICRKILWRDRICKFSRQLSLKIPRASGLFPTWVKINGNDRRDCQQFFFGEIFNYKILSCWFSFKFPISLGSTVCFQLTVGLWWINHGNRDHSCTKCELKVLLQMLHLYKYSSLFASSSVIHKQWDKARDKKLFRVFFQLRSLHNSECSVNSFLVILTS